MPPLAAGEQMYRRHDFRAALEAAGLGIVQPGRSHACGIIAVFEEGMNM